MKRQERSRQLGPLETLETRALLTLAATAPLPNLYVGSGAAVASVNLDSYFKDSAPAPDYAIFNTTLGTIPVLLTPSTTPVTVANFESYVGKGDYNNTIVHRSVPGFIWQTGGFQLTSTPNIAPITAGPAIKNEFGASNTRGTIAMAKLGSDPNSATNQFFFNESDSNAANLDNQNGGFTVFGHVVGAPGLAVMDAVAAVPVPSPGPLNSPLDQIPLQNYTSGATVQPSNLILIKSVTTASELFLTTSDTPTVATGSVQGSNLTITPLTPGIARITVVGYGSDGLPATETFSVTVSPSASAPVTPPPPSQPPTNPPAPTPVTPPAATPAPTSPPASVAATPPGISGPISVPASPPPVAVPPSALTLTTRGTVPASVVAGQKIKIGQAVSLLAGSGAVSQVEHVSLSLASSETGAYVIAVASPRVNLKAGKHANLNLSASRLGPGVSVGAYHVLVSVTDPNGSSTTVDTGKMVVVTAPRLKGSRK